VFDLDEGRPRFSRGAEMVEGIERPRCGGHRHLEKKGQFRREMTEPLLKTLLIFGKFQSGDGQARGRHRGMRPSGCIATENAASRAQIPGSRVFVQDK
jgi:hypothetical protein